MSILPQASHLTEPQTEAQKLILCLACGHAVTAPKQAIQVQGAHEHTFRNPAGYSFHVLCFGEAPGCLCLGDPTVEATWFAGYAWTFAICGGCHQHLGWHYAGSSRSFFGLIATRLKQWETGPEASSPTVPGRGLSGGR